MRSSQLDIRCRFVSSGFVIALGLIALAWRHAYYLSICEIDHNPHTKALEITVKIFTDDLEGALEAQGVEKLNLGTPQEAKHASGHIFEYVQNKLMVIIDGDTVAFTNVGKEVEREVTWCYVEAKNVPPFKKLTVTNRLLIERHEEQANIVHVKTGKVRKSLLLHKNKTAGTLEFP